MSKQVRFEDVKNSPVVTGVFQGKKYYTDFQAASKVYMVDGNRLTPAEKNLVMSLQGIVAKSMAQIFIEYWHTKVWREEMEQHYGMEFLLVDNCWELVDLFREHLHENGFVRYVQQQENKILSEREKTSINVACTIAGQENYLIVEDGLIPQAIEHGLTQKMDACLFDQKTIFWGDESQNFAGYKDRVNRQVVVSLLPTETNGRDLGIALGAYFWRYPQLEDFSECIAYLDDNGIILGWHDNEGDGCIIGTERSWTTVASDHANNYSLYAGLPSTTFCQKPRKQYARANHHVHYVTYLISDGDNIMWLETGFAQAPNYYGAKNRGAIPFGWSMNPVLLEIAPQMVENFYRRATENDEFYASFSGLGYTYPDRYAVREPEKRTQLLEEYYKRTAEYMKAVDEHVVAISEWRIDHEDDETRRELLSAYAKQDQIQGGFLYYIYQHYELPAPRAGAVYWCNGKPFVNLRESLGIWSYEVTRETKIEKLSSIAYRINHYKRDASVIEGYSAVNVHPWSFSYDDVVGLTEMLDDDVVVVSPSEFIDLIKKNVKQEQVLKLNDVYPTDYSNMKLYTDKDRTPMWIP